LATRADCPANWLYLPCLARDLFVCTFPFEGDDRRCSFSIVFLQKRKPEASLPRPSPSYFNPCIGAYWERWGSLFPHLNGLLHCTDNAEISLGTLTMTLPSFAAKFPTSLIKEFLETRRVSPGRPHLLEASYPNILFRSLRALLLRQGGRPDPAALWLCRFSWLFLLQGRSEFS